jgi:peptidoglycan hydrolase-like protein with peptidoglycan-binding domain
MCLQTLGYNLIADGSFGVGTEAFVKKFQSDNFLAVDGMMGNKSRAILEMLARNPKVKIKKLSNTFTLVRINKADIRLLDILDAGKTLKAVRDYHKDLKNKPDLMFNLGFFDMKTGDTISLTVDNGVKEGKTGYYGFNLDNMKFELYKDQNNFISGYPALVINGHVQQVKRNAEVGEQNVILSKDPIMYAKHPRLCLGDDENNIVLLIADGRTTGKTGASISEMQLMAMKNGVKNMINLDGGGSLMVLDKTGTAINTPTENRKIDKVMGVWL